MQVSHDIQVIEPSKQSRLDQDLKALDEYTISQQCFSDPIRLIAMSPNGFLAAIYVSQNNQIVMFDTRLRQIRDRFLLKACDKKFSRNSFTARALEFSPDSNRLAVGQSDCVIYIYKLSGALLSPIAVPGSSHPTNNSSKLTITGKFVCSSPITCVCWCEAGILFGTQDGKIKLVQFISQLSKSGQSSATQEHHSATSNESSNNNSKVTTIFNSSKGSMPLCLAYRSPFAFIGLVDRSLIVVYLPVENSPYDYQSEVNNSSRRGSSLPSIQFGAYITIEHSCPIEKILVFGYVPMTFCCAGHDGKLAIYEILFDSDGKNFRTNNIQRLEIADEIQSMDYSQSNEIIALATIKKLLFIRFDTDSKSWRIEVESIQLERSIGLSCVKWTKDGSQLVVGTIIGSVELFQCSWSKESISEQLDICHIARNRIRISDRSRNLLATYKSDQDIKRVNVIDQGRNVIIWTSGSRIILAKLSHNDLQSIVRLSGNSNYPGQGVRDPPLKFHFDFSGLVLILNEQNGHVHIVKLGNDSILFTINLTVRNVPLFNLRSICIRQHPCAEDLAKEARREQYESSRKLMFTDTLRERLAYISPDNNNSLLLINLKSEPPDSRTFRHDQSIKMIDISLTGKNLALVDDKSRTYLLKWSDSKDDPIEVIEIMDSDCLFAAWLPRTEILVTQCKNKISICYKLRDLKANALSAKNSSPPKSFAIFDSRSFNINKEAPIIDLSNDSNGLKYPLISRLGYSCIELSNGQSIELDSLKVKFFSNLDISIESAQAILESMTNTNDTTKSLWIILLWMAVEQSNHLIAKKSMKRLGYRSSWISYMESCDQNNSSSLESQIKMAKFRGDWQQFEQLAEAEQIQITYKRLNKWTKLIDYLNRMQQFRQRDIVEKEYRQWLLDQGRPLDAARLIARKAGDLFDAIDLLTNANLTIEGAQLLLTENNLSLKLQQEPKLVDLIEGKILPDLLRLEKFNLAARISSQALGRKHEALNLYEKANNFEPAIMIAIDLGRTEKVNELRIKYANQLLQLAKICHPGDNKALKGIEQLLEADQHIEAIQATIQLNLPIKGYEILVRCVERKSDETILINVAKELSSLLESRDKIEEASNCLKLTKQYDLMFKLLLDHEEYEKAFDVCVQYLHSNNRDEALDQFEKIANDMLLIKDDTDPAKTIERVELIQLKVLSKPILAIEMHRRLGNFERMLELIEKYESDQLEGQLLWVAKEYEKLGQLDKAESYLLRVSDSEWTNVVRMYRLEGNWEQAYRVAKNYCSSSKDPILIQLGFWWARSLQDIKTAYELLYKDLKILGPVLEFCLENKSYSFALEMCDEHLSSNQDQDTQYISRLRREVLKRIAGKLEQDNKLKEAEEILVKYNLIEDTINMYKDNELYSDAIRVIEHEINVRDITQTNKNSINLKELLNETLVDCGKRLSEGVGLKGLEVKKLTRGGFASEKKLTTDEESRLQQAQQLYLRAQRPDLAISMYQDRGLWQKAVQLAQRYAPHLLEQVEKDLDSTVSLDLDHIEQENNNQDESLVYDNDSTSRRRINETKKEVNSDTSLKGFDDIDDLTSSKLSELMNQMESFQRNPMVAMVSMSNFINSLQVVWSSNSLRSSQIDALEKVLFLPQVNLLTKSYPQERLVLIRSISELCFRLVDACTWCLPGDSTGDEEKFWSKWSNVLDGIDNYNHDEASEILNQARALAKTISDYSDSLDKFVTQWGHRKGSVAMGKLAETRSNRQSLSSPATKLIIKPSNAKNLLRNLTNSKQQITSLAQQSLSVRTLVMKIENQFANALIMVNYISGLWMLAAGSTNGTRQVWTELIDLQDKRLSAMGSNGGLKTAIHLDPSIVNEVKTWLLESLLDIDSSSSNDGKFVIT